MMVKIVDIIFARTPFWSTDWQCSNDQRAVGHYIHGSEPTGACCAYRKLRHFSLYFGEYCWYKPVQNRIWGGIYADLLDSHPRNCSTDHQLLDLFGAFENVVNLRISMPAFYGVLTYISVSAQDLDCSLC